MIKFWMKTFYLCPHIFIFIRIKSDFELGRWTCVPTPGGQYAFRITLNVTFNRWDCRGNCLNRNLFTCIYWDVMRASLALEFINWFTVRHPFPIRIIHNRFWKKWYFCSLQFSKRDLKFDHMKNWPIKRAEPLFFSGVWKNVSFWIIIPIWDHNSQLKLRCFTRKNMSCDSCRKKNYLDPSG